MIRFLIRKLIRDYPNTKDSGVRSSYLLLSGGIGIVCNLFLFGLKLTVGLVMNSIAIVSDAFNNLSDMGSSAISAISARLSNQEPDEKHPQGHGRLEYLASLLVSALIVVVAIELGKSSIEKIIRPEELTFRWYLVALLTVSVFVKLWLFFANRYMGKEISSPLLLATAQDSISDSIATSVVIIATVLSPFVSFPLDGIMGVLVALVILRAGISIAKDTIDLLLGGKPDAELLQSIEELVLSGEGIVGVHDLIIHNYGPGRNFASCHAEVPADADIVQVHEVIDAIELAAKKDPGVILVIHMDPIETDNEDVTALREQVAQILHDVDETYTMHDFRITNGENHINLIFDVVVPLNQKEKEYSPKIEELRRRIREADKRFGVVLQIDRSYV